MLRFPWPSNRPSARRVQLGLAGLVVAALLLLLPAAGFAQTGAAARGSQTERGESSETALTSAGLLGRGAGYSTPSGSRSVRELQARLRRLGDAPGPVDGLYGPLTEAAVQRFQGAHGLAVDGVVGPRTKQRLIARPAQRPAERRPAPPAEPKPSSEPKPSAEPSPAPAADSSAQPAPSRGIAPGFAALLGALGAGLLLTALWAVARRRERVARPEPAAADRPAPEARLNLGMACAALLAVFAAGAAGGAVFATRAAPDADEAAALGRGVTAVDPFEGGSAAAVEQSRSQRQPRREPAAARKRAPTRVATTEQPAGGLDAARRAAPRAPRAAPPAPLATASAPPPVTPAPPAGATYTVRPGDSLWPIAKGQLSPDSSNAAVAARVRRISALNLADRIASGNPDVLAAGEELRLR